MGGTPRSLLSAVNLKVNTVPADAELTSVLLTVVLSRPQGPLLPGFRRAKLSDGVERLALCVPLRRL